MRLSMHCRCLHALSILLVLCAVLPGDGHAATRVTLAQLVEIGEPPQGEFRLEGLTRTGAGQTWLKLSPTPIFTDGARLVVVGEGGAREHPLPAVRHYLGHERDDPSAAAFVSVHPDGRVRGWLRHGGRIEAFGREPGESMSTLSLSRVDLSAAAAGRPFSCGSEALGHLHLEPEPGKQTVSPAPAHDLISVSEAAGRADSISGGVRWMGVAIDSDYEYYQRFNNVDAATAYTADLIGYASLMYRNETNTGLLIPYLRLFNQPSDPWSQVGSTACSLFEFGLHWHQNQGQVQRSFAHLLSGKNLGGGIAWLGTACRTSNQNFDITDQNCPGLPNIAPYAGGYGVSASLAGNFNPANPQALWDIVVVSHEIGHNLSSPHTHCYGNVAGNPVPVDQCYVESPPPSGLLCHAGNVSLPGPQGQASGTIMSYCHQRPGGLGNIALSFGTGHPYGVQPARVPNRIRGFVDQAPASCLFEPGPGNDAIFSSGFECVAGTPGCTGAVCLSSQGATANGAFASGDPNNRVRLLNIGSGNQLTGLAVDVRVEARSPSWLSEARIVFSSSNIAGYRISYTPGLKMEQPGTINHSSNGVVTFVSQGLQNVVAGADGILRVEWNETFDDPEVNPDSLWSNHPTPTVCGGLRLVCTNQAACNQAAQAAP